MTTVVVRFDGAEITRVAGQQAEGTPVRIRSPARQSSLTSLALTPEPSHRSISMSDAGVPVEVNTRAVSCSSEILRRVIVVGSPFPASPGLDLPTHNDAANQDGDV